MMAWIGAVYATLLVASPCTPDADGFCTDDVINVELSYAQPDVKLMLNVVIGDSLLLLFDDVINVPKMLPLGNQAAFKLESRDHGAVIWPHAPSKNYQGSLAGITSNLHIPLKEAGINILIVMRIVETNAGVQRVHFSFPELAREVRRSEALLAQQRAKLQEEKAALEQSLQDKAELWGIKVIGRKAATYAHCRPVDKHDTGLVRLSVSTVCQLDDLLVVAFSVTNRHRNSVIVLSDVKVVSEGSKSAALSGAVVTGPEEDAFHMGINGALADTRIPYAKTIRRAAVVPIGQSIAPSYRLEVTAEGGKTLSVSGIRL